MARGSKDIVKKNSKLESFLHRSLTDEAFDRIRGYESCICVSEQENRTFKYVVLSDEWIYLTENPPKTIRGAVHLRDVVKVELVHDLPDFLSGAEQSNTQHIAVTHVCSQPPRRRSLRRSRHARSPHGSLSDLGERSRSSTPLGYASSLDGSQDGGYFTQSAASLPHSRPTSRGSVGSQREGRANGGRKKKGGASGAGDKRDHDSFLRSLKEEREEEEHSHPHHPHPRLSTPHRHSLNAARSSPGPGKTIPDPSNRPLPLKSGSAGVKGKPGQVTSQKVTSLCAGWFCCGNRSQVVPGSKADINTSALSSQGQFEKEEAGSVPTVPVIYTPEHKDRSSHSGRPALLMTNSPRPRSLTPSLDANSMGGSVRELGGLSVEGGPQRSTVLHIYLLTASSPIMGLLRAAWTSYLMKATLSLEMGLDKPETSYALTSSVNQRERGERVLSQLMQQVGGGGCGVETFTQAFTSLLHTAQSNFLIKKLFWQQWDVVRVLVQQLQRYMPCPLSSLASEDAKAQRVNQLELVLVLVKTLSLMLRESQLTPATAHVLQADRGKVVVDLLVTLTSSLSSAERQIVSMKQWWAAAKTAPPSAPSLNQDPQLYQLLSEYTQVSIAAVFELFFISKQVRLEKGEGGQLTVAWMVAVLDQCGHTDQFVERVMGVVMETINVARFGAVSSGQAVCLYQHFSLLLSLLQHSPRALPLLSQHYHEEFKYFIQGPALARRLPPSFPITGVTLQLVAQVCSKVLQHHPRHPTPR